LAAGCAPRLLLSEPPRLLVSAMYTVPASSTSTSSGRFVAKRAG
jgi:hypothetical protein